MLDRFIAIPASFSTTDGERLSWRAYVFLMLLCLASFAPGIATLPPTDRDESLFAQASKQMIETGNYVDIRVQDQPRYKKPIGIYWLQTASARLLSPQHLDRIWAYRIPSFIGAIIAVTMTAALGTLLFGPLEGLLAGIMLAGCLILNIEARLAKTDACLLASVVVAQYALARAYVNYGHARLGWGVFFAFWMALGAGVLFKGPIILLIVVLTLLWLFYSEKNLRWFLALRPLLGVPLALLVVMPWFVAIMLESHGQFLEQSAGHDLLGKLWQDQGRGFLPPGSYLLAFPVTFFPFGLWALMAAPDSWLTRKVPSVRFCLGWIVPNWCAFELVMAKLPHYVMPLYPAVAILAAKALLDGLPALAERRFRWLPPVAVGLWMVIGTAFVLAASALPYVLDNKWNAGQMLTGFLLIAAQVASLFLFFQRRESSVLVMAAGSLLFLTSLFGSNLPNVPELWLSQEIATAAAGANPCPGAPLLVSTFNEPSLVFLGGTNTILRNWGDGVAAEMRKEPCRMAAIEHSKTQRFVDSFATSPVKPQPVATVRGFVLARGTMDQVTLYILPKDSKP